MGEWRYENMGEWPYEKMEYETQENGGMKTWYLCRTEI